MKRFKIFSKKTIIAGSVIFVSFLFILMAFAPALSGAGQTATPATTEKSYIPNPTLNTNVSWSTFYHGWTPLEYNNGSANKTLNTGISSFYSNPISVDPLDIKTTALNYENYTTNTSLWTIVGTSGYGTSPAGGAVASISKNTNGNVIFTMNGSSAAANDLGIGTPILFSKMPSNSLQYDYITIEYEITGTSQTGALEQTDASDNNGGNITQTAPVNTPMYFSYNIGKYYNLTDYENHAVEPVMLMDLAQGLTGSYTLTLYGFDISTEPMYLGTQIANNTSVQATNIIGNAELNNFDPYFAWTEIANNGYSVAVSQTMTNTTESQTSISDGSYIEEATYQGILSMPTAPDLTYAGSNITLNMTLPGSQYEVATLNGVSYLSGVQGEKNGTFAFGTVNPNSPNSMILEAKYTSSQWDSSTHAPSFFSIRGIEYYWWVGVIGLLSLIGLGAAASAHWGGEEEGLKVPKGKFGR